MAKNVDIDNVSRFAPRDDTLNKLHGLNGTRAEGTLVFGGGNEHLPKPQLSDHEDNSYASVIAEKIKQRQTPAEESAVHTPAKFAGDILAREQFGLPQNPNNPALKQIQEKQVNDLTEAAKRIIDLPAHDATAQEVATAKGKLESQELAQGVPLLERKTPGSFARHEPKE